MIDQKSSSKLNFVKIFIGRRKDCRMEDKEQAKVPIRIPSY